MSEPIPAKSYRDMIEKASGKKRSKYGSKKTYVGSLKFDSVKEGKRYSELFIMQHRGLISALELQPRYPLIVNGRKVCTYVADFRYLDGSGRVRVEDVKGVRTPTYKLKKKLFEALYVGLEIEEL